MSNTVSVTITQQSNYQFLVDFGTGISPLQADEAAPLGAGEGLSPSQLLLAAVTNCLSASLFFALQKFKQVPITGTSFNCGGDPRIILYLCVSAHCAATFAGLW